MTGNEGILSRLRKPLLEGRPVDAWLCLPALVYERVDHVCSFAVGGKKAALISLHRRGHLRGHVSIQTENSSAWNIRNSEQSNQNERV